VTALLDPPTGAPDPPAPPHGTPRATGVLAFLTTTDHKRIGIAYLVTSFAFFLLGGALALVMRTELIEPGLQVTSANQYNQLFTMHGTIMMFLFIGPFAFGLANYLVPLHIGAADMSFPRLNSLSYWLFLGGGLTLVAGFLTSDGPAATGWTLYPPLSQGAYTPSIGTDLVLLGLALTGFSGIFTAVNVVTTVFTMRAPGMTMFRLPVFTWNMVVVSLLVLMAFPILTAASAMLFVDRNLGGHIFDPSEAVPPSSGSTSSGSSGTPRSTSSPSPSSG
jgi:cytochrome c oxidase subunit 1